MKKVLGVIVEYNPFHNGHLYHIQKSKEATGCDYVIGVMSGNYVQRGEPAIINKWSRTKIALDNGIDLLIELPTVYASQSAEGFSLGAVNLLAKTGVVTDICFGSESGDVTPLFKVAKRLLELENNNSIKDKLRAGVSYANALGELIDDSSVLKGSNNILAVEYLKQIISQNINIKVNTIKRFNNNYNDQSLPQDNIFIASATALRPQIRANSNGYKNFLPKNSYKTLQETLKNQQVAGDLDVMSDFFFNLLIRNGESDLKKLARVEVGLDNRIINNSINASTISDLIDLVKSKRYPKSRISRLILQFILKIEQDLVLNSNENPGQYIRILGCNEKGLKLMKSMKNNADVPFSLNYNKLIKSFPQKNLAKKQLELENQATNLYTSFFYKKYIPQLEYTKNAIILN